MTRLWLALPAALLLVAALSGCVASDEDGEPAGGTTGTDDGMGGNGTSNNTTANIEVTITTYPSQANASEDIMVEYTISGVDDESQLESQGVVWAGTSQPSPNSTADYMGNQSEGTPGTSASGNATAGNTSANATVGNESYTATFTAEGNGTLYVRAYATVGGMDHFSDEVTIELSQVGEVHTVTIRSAANGYLSGYDPAELTIAVGDAVVWENADDVVHTATSDDDAWDTGDIEAGNTSMPIVFDAPGEYAYSCSHHGLTMHGTIIVQ